MIYLTQLSSYTYCALINPGIPKRNMNLENNNIGEITKEIRNYRICKICNILMNKDENTCHCEDCGTCIEGRI